jgi:non-lysosomal glucosylceramidase
MHRQLIIWRLTVLAAGLLLGMFACAACDLQSSRAACVGNRRSAVADTNSEIARRMPTYKAHRLSVDQLMRQLSEHSDKTPAVKKFGRQWVQSLTDRGTPTIYTRENSSNFEYIGMPVGGICAGQLYLGGDGKLWYWDIFNTKKMKDTHSVRSYREPYRRSDTADKAQNVLKQGFAIRLHTNQKVITKQLDRDSFTTIKFAGQYPIGEVTYTDPSLPVEVKLQAFSPFIPLDLASSTYPATMLEYSITNKSDEDAEGELFGWLENAVCIESRHAQPCTLRNRIEDQPDLVTLQLDATPRDQSTPKEPLRDLPDYGSMALAVVAKPPNAVATAEFDPPAGNFTAKAFATSSSDDAPQVGAVGRRFHLKPGESTDVRFVLAWYFPNCRKFPISTPQGRFYGVRFESAAAVAQEIGDKWSQLASQTRLWRDTWYDSTLPYWFLDRTFANTSTLATNTCYLFRDGRFYGYEGVYHGVGTCTHVWGYVQAVGRLFPVLEQRLREMVDYKPGVGFDPTSGRIFQRGESSKRDAVDGQSGVILRTYLVHEMQKDDAFLRTVYPVAKKAMTYLVDEYDADRDGILTGSQLNTLDAAWYGKIPWLSLYYQAALRVTAAMADEIGDRIYATKCRQLADRGRNYLESKLFNGEYFFQQSDPEHPESPGSYNGLEYSQLLGQSWAYQVGLGEILDPAKVTTHLRSLWKYNFTTDVGPYREKYTNGRWFALPGEGGIIASTWPRGGDEVLGLGNRHFAGYLNECQPGYEWAVTSLMMWHGMPYYALAHARTMFDRYLGSKRNPWNEVEWGDHYSRSMASYGVFTAVCGFEYNGPQGYLAFSPRITPNRFKAAFTTAKGWGTFAQERSDGTQRDTLDVRWGELSVRTLAFDLPAGKKSSAVFLRMADRKIPAHMETRENRVMIHLHDKLKIAAGERLTIEIRY